MLVGEIYTYIISIKKYFHITYYLFVFSSSDTLIFFVVFVILD